MRRKLLIFISTFVFGFVILFISILRTASVKPDFRFNHNDFVRENAENNKNLTINYTLVYPGSVLPNSPLWVFKALRDKFWFMITTDPGRKAELKLLFADKRLAMAKILFEKGEFEVGYTTLSKGEKYLEEASLDEENNRKKGIDTTDFLKTLTLASLKHRQVVRELSLNCPEEMMPFMVKVEDYSRNVYQTSMHALNEKGLKAPVNPFDGL